MMTDDAVKEAERIKRREYAIDNAARFLENNGVSVDMQDVFSARRVAREERVKLVKEVIEQDEVCSEEMMEVIRKIVGRK